MFKESPYFKEEIRGTPYPKKGERQILRRSLAEKAITILEKLNCYFQVQRLAPNPEP
jgi:hypothetical protein